MTPNVRGFAGVVLFTVAVGGWAHPGAAQSQAPPEPERLLCGSGSESGIKPRVLVGRFPKIGDVEQNSGLTLEYGFKGGLVAGLLIRNDAIVHVWGSDTELVRRFKDLSDQITNAFVGGTPRDQQRNTLAEILKAQNCQYLLGGRISQDAEAITVMVYLLEARSGRVQRFSPVIGDVPSLMRSADRFAADFTTFLPSTQARVIEAACISIPAELPISLTETQRLAAAMRERLVQGLADDKRFLVKSLADKAICATSVNASDDASLVVSAEVRGAKDGIEIRPVVRISDSSASRNTSITLPVLTRPVADVVAVPADFAEAVRAFLFVTTRNDGSFAEESSSAPQVASDRLWSILEHQLQQGYTERVALTAYRLLSENPENALASYMLARAFLLKQRPQLAFDYCLQAKQRAREGWSDERLAGLNELSGQALQMLKRPSESQAFFREAIGLYTKAGRQADSARVRRSLAIALFASDDKNKAFDELRSQPDLETDVESLRLLGLFFRLSDQFSEAIVSLKKALAADPNDEATKTTLADSYESVGKKEFAAKRYPQARAFFELAVAQRSDPRRIYLAALPSYESRDFDDVASKLELAVKGMDAGTGEKLSPVFVEAIWLTLFEAYLLLGRYEEIDKRFDAAALVLKPGSRLLASYFRFCAQAIGDSSKTAADLEKGQLYQGILGTLRVLEQSECRGVPEKS
jgi:tetratricopeptide (TPR) repeat protein